MTIKAVEKINAGDQLEIWVKVGGRINFTVDKINRRGDLLTLTVDNTKGVRVHDRVFKIFDAELAAHAQTFFADPAVNKIPVDAEISARIDERLRVKFSDPEGNVAAVETKIVAVKAENRPIDKKLLEKQLGRLGGTEFALRNLTVDIEGELMIPISELNDVRRRAIERLETLRLKKYLKSAPSMVASSQTFTRKNFSAQQLIAAIDTLEKFSAIDGADGIIFGGDTFNHKTLTVEDHRRAIEMARSKGKKIYIGTPRIIRNNELSELEKIIRAVGDADGIYIHNIGTLRLVRRLTRLPIFTDFSLIAFNSTTIDELQRLGVEGVTLSPELTLDQIKTIRAELPIECIIGGRAELMIMFYCPMGSFAGCGRICERKKFFLRDRMNAEFPIVTDQHCRAHILNSKVLSMADRVDELRSIDRLRIDGRAMSVEELKSTIKKFRAALDGKSIVEEGITHGHFFRGV